jgi:hypothetical protein
MPERPHKSEKRFSRDKAAAKVGHPQPVVAAGGSQDGMNREKMKLDGGKRHILLAKTARKLVR